MLRMRLDGSALLMTDADPAKAQRGYDARLNGVLIYDPQQKAFTRFDAVAIGDYWGGDYEGGRFKRPGRTPLGISFELVRGDRAVDRLAHQVGRGQLGHCRAQQQHHRQRQPRPVGPDKDRQPPHQPAVVGLAEDFIVVVRGHEAESSSSSSCFRWSSA